MMFKTGLLSVSFRNEMPETVVRAAQRSGLFAIEWGGDVHVPAGDLKQAVRVAAVTAEYGLETAAYGSYFSVGQPFEEFLPVTDTAAALGAKTVRIWAGRRESSLVTAEDFGFFCAETVKLSEHAEKYGLRLAFECHHGTLTDDYTAALKILQKCNKENLKMLWQPNQFKSEEYNIAAAKALAPHTVNLHVFHWTPSQRLPLSEGIGVWQKYLAVFSENARDYGLLLEFMHDGRLESLGEAANALRVAAGAANRKNENRI